MAGLRDHQAIIKIAGAFFLSPIQYSFILIYYALTLALVDLKILVKY